MSAGVGVTRVSAPSPDRSDGSESDTSDASSRPGSVPPSPAATPRPARTKANVGDFLYGKLLGEGSYARVSTAGTGTRDHCLADGHAFAGMPGVDSGLEGWWGVVGGGGGVVGGGMGGERGVGEWGGWVEGWCGELRGVGLRKMGDGGCWGWCLMQVVHCKQRNTGVHYAVKILDKRMVRREGKVANVMMERDVMTRATHHCVVKLLYTFQTKEELFFVMSLCRGGDLRKVVDLHRREARAEGRDGSALPPSVAQFYIAQCICALEYLHLGLSVVHRDLKPENVLLDADGHVKLADFGTAKFQKEAEAGEAARPGRRRANSAEFCGTAEYVSPEVVGDEPATGASDLWALGCMVYQLLSGAPPFQGPNEFSTMQAIQDFCEGHEPLKWPPGITPEAKHLIMALLQPDPTKRLGSHNLPGLDTSTSAGKGKGGEGEGEEGGEEDGVVYHPKVLDYAALKEHPFFQGIKWETVGTKQAVAPFTPPLTKLPEPKSATHVSWEALGEMIEDADGAAEGGGRSETEEEEEGEGGKGERGEEGVAGMPPPPPPPPAASTVSATSIPRSASVTSTASVASDDPLGRWIASLGGGGEGVLEHWGRGMSDEHAGVTVEAMEEALASTPPGESLPSSLWAETWWEPHVRPGEKVLMFGIVGKKRGVFSLVHDRLLVLTDAPRLFYLDHERQEFKSDIPWDKDAVLAPPDVENVQWGIRIEHGDYLMRCRAKRASRWVQTLSNFLAKEKLERRKDEGE